MLATYGDITNNSQGSTPMVFKQPVDVWIDNLGVYDPERQELWFRAMEGYSLAIAFWEIASAKNQYRPGVRAFAACQRCQRVSSRHEVAMNTAKRGLYPMSIFVARICSVAPWPAILRESWVRRGRIA